jgi:hypothetical protein
MRRLEFLGILRGNTAPLRGCERSTVLADYILIHATDGCSEGRMIL